MKKSHWVSPRKRRKLWNGIVRQLKSFSTRPAGQLTRRNEWFRFIMMQWRPNPEICLYCIFCGAAVENAGQERRFIGGSQQISNRLKDKLGDRVK